jgi:hypothetical protein
MDPWKDGNGLFLVRIESNWLEHLKERAPSNFYIISRQEDATKALKKMA